jgi:hypothetical protein
MKRCTITSLVEIARKKKGQNEIEKQRRFSSKQLEWALHRSSEIRTDMKRAASGDTRRVITCCLVDHQPAPGRKPHGRAGTPGREESNTKKKIKT